ncbi:MAG: HlyC/CorC family transporter [Verrucomicrobia bacterium]|nr:HlyC/CorC family transporter [Verrucomicrobiota bacterium]
MLGEAELLAIYAVLVLLSTAAGLARESLLALRAGGRTGGSQGRAATQRLSPERDDEYLLTILIVNSMAKLASVCLLFLAFRAVTSSEALQLVLALVTGSLVILLVTELIPRHVARAHPVVWFDRLGWFVRLLHVVFYPLGWATRHVVRWLKRAYGIEGSIFPLPQTPHALLELIEATEENGKLEEDDRELITSIFEFRDTIVREVMVPRVDMVCIDQQATLEEAHRLVVDKGHSRVPVYRDNLDDIVGVLFTKDLLASLGQGAFSERRVGEVLHEPMFVPETKRVAELLREFQKARLHLAIVVDEYGGTSGLVTIEDLLEEIVGDIRDEYDTEPPLYEPDGHGGYVVDAKISIGEIEDDLGITLPEEEEYDTLGGFLFARLGKVPEPGDVLRENGVELTVLEADGRRIYKVRVTPIDAGQIEPDDING